MLAQRKTVLFFPLNSPGHINSSLGIADRFKEECGHRTVFLLLGKMMGNSILEHGHELVMLDEVNPYEDYEIEPSEDPNEPADEEFKKRQGKTKVKFEGVNKWPQLITRHQRLFRLDPVEAFIESCPIMETSMVKELFDNHENYKIAIDEIAPDLIIIDAYYVPPCVLSLTIPWVRLYSANPLMIVNSRLENGVKPPGIVGTKLFSKRERERIRRDEPEKWTKMLEEWRKINDRMFSQIGKSGSLLAEFLANNGCEPIPPGQQAHHSPHLNIYMFPKAIDYDQDDDLFVYPPRWLRCDSLIRKQATPEDSEEIRMWEKQLDTHLNNKEAVIFFSLGSIASGDWKLMQRYVEMLKYDKRRLYVVSKGVNGDKYDLCPSNMIGTNYLPQTFFLQRANLAIIHGGNNSVTECMYYGIPMIVMPMFADQLDNAQRIEDLGIGRKLDVHKCSREELLGCVDEVLRDRTITDRLRDIGQAMQSRDDIGRVTRVLNKLMEDKQLTDEYLNAELEQS